MEVTSQPAQAGADLFAQEVVATNILAHELDRSVDVLSCRQGTPNRTQTPGGSAVPATGTLDNQASDNNGLTRAARKDKTRMKL